MWRQLVTIGMCTTYLVATDYAVTWKILNGETLARCENGIADAVV